MPLRVEKRRLFRHRTQCGAGHNPRRGTRLQDLMSNEGPERCKIVTRIGNKFLFAPCAVPYRFGYLELLHATARPSKDGTATHLAAAAPGEQAMWLNKKGSRQ